MDNKKYKRRFIFAVILLLSYSAFAKKNPRSISGGSREAGAAAVSILSEESETYSIEVTAAGDYIFYPSTNPLKTGFIFYPGGMVKVEAYLPLVKALAEKGYCSVLVRMPKDLAVFNQKGADKFIKRFTDIEHWFIGGHSLGGSMAASFASTKSKVFDGIVLFAAYSTKKINDDISVLSVFGSCDGVLAKDKYEKYKKNLPADFTEFVIEGGCHSYFGDYGMQDGDGNPTITRNEQICIVSGLVDEFIKSSIKQ